MTTSTTAELLKYADLQMADEAFLVQDAATGQLKSNLKQALIEGNGHNSVFTSTQADNFLAHWQVVAQKPNTTTCFSDTLFKCIKDDPSTGAKKDELVMSMRSTEFIDDAARDNQATNVLEIKETGFAWGQLRDMNAWYQELTAAGGPLGEGQSFSVTGYSLGGHLASAFHMMYGAAKETVTFNGAGIGSIATNTFLAKLVDTFNTLSSRLGTLSSGDDKPLKQVANTDIAQESLDYISSAANIPEAGDTVDAGEGDDQVIASWGVDRVQGGAGDDHIDGLAGDDILEGGDGDDNIQADGIVRAGYLNSVDSAHHGADFADGEDGNDLKALWGSNLGADGFNEDAAKIVAACTHSKRARGQFLMKSKIARRPKGFHSKRTPAWAIQGACHA